MKTAKKLAFVLLLATATYASEKRVFSILGHDTGKYKADYVIRPMVAPLLAVRQISGPPLPATGDINCTWRNEDTNHIRVLRGYCEGGIVIELNGIDLNH